MTPQGGILRNRKSGDCTNHEDHDLNNRAYDNDPKRRKLRRYVVLRHGWVWPFWSVILHGQARKRIPEPQPSRLGLFRFNTGRFAATDKRLHDGWLDEKGRFYHCRCHISWVVEDLEHENELLYKRYKEWFANERTSGETGIEFLMRQGWWKRSTIASSKLWVGEKRASPEQRRYINRDMGERQSNNYFEGEVYSA